MMLKILRIVWIPVLLGLTIIGTLAAQQFGLLNFFQAEKQITITVVLDKVQALSTLTTNKYTYSGIVTSERQMPGVLSALYGEKLAYMAVGYITAGIDLSQMSESDATLQDSVLNLRLPAPSLQECFLDEKASYVVSRDSGLFTSGAPNVDAEARRFAITQFRDTALETGILNDVQTQAIAAITAFLQLTNDTSIRQIIITFAATDPAAPLPASCR